MYGPAALVALAAAASQAAAVLVAPPIAPLADRSLTSRPRKGFAFGKGIKQKRSGWRIQNGDDSWAELGAAEQAEKGPEQVNLVPVVLGVMSKCPDASSCESTFDKVLSNVGNKVDLSLVYIGTLNSSSTYGVTCKHGELECKGNIQQLCYKRTYPQQKDWWNFITCQNYAGLSKVGEDALAERCAKVGGKSWSDAQKCVDESGSKLLQASVRSAQHMDIHTSCSIMINNRLVCIRDDGAWRNCDAGHEVQDFVGQINEEYERLNGKS